MTGETQGRNAPRSRAHSKVEPTSLEARVKVAVVSVVDEGGPEAMVVCGGVVSGPAAEAVAAEEAAEAPSR